MTRQAAFRYLQEHKGISFLIEFYDVEHLQSMDETIDDLLIICQKNGGTLAWYSDEVARLLQDRYLDQQYYFGTERALSFLHKTNTETLWANLLIIKSQHT